MTPRQMGRKGGKTTGASKVRGDSDYYRALAAKRKILPILHTYVPCDVGDGCDNNGCHFMWRSNKVCGQLASAHQQCPPHPGIAR